MRGFIIDENLIFFLITKLVVPILIAADRSNWKKKEKITVALPFSYYSLSPILMVLI